MTARLRKQGMNSNRTGMYLKRGLTIAWMILGVAFLVGCISTDPGNPGANTKPPASVDDSVDELRVGDKLNIVFKDIPGGPQLHEVRIREDGKISVPFIIEPIDAAGKKTWVLQDELWARYVPSYYTRLTVIVSTDSRYVTISGQVKAPGVVPYFGEMTVLKALTTAGDFTDFAKKKKVKVTRSDGRVIEVNCVKAIKNPELDISVYPGDKIHVPRRIW